jgi:hypothetical protein
MECAKPTRSSTTVAPNLAQLAEDVGENLNFKQQ